MATKSKETSGTITLGSSTHLVRLFEFIPGEILHKLPNCETKVFYEVGILTARIDNVLQVCSYNLVNSKRWSFSKFSSRTLIIPRTGNKRNGVWAKPLIYLITYWPLGMPKRLLLETLSRNFRIGCLPFRII